jgi:hypothetical protein
VILGGLLRITLVSAKSGWKKGLNHGMNKILKSLDHEVRPLTSQIIPQKRWQWLWRNCQ